MRAIYVGPLCSLVVLLMSFGCAVSRYQYISLADQPDVKVEAYDAPRLKRLYFSSAIPVEYSVKRKDYKLSFRTNLDTYFPQMQIGASGSDGEPLRMTQQAARRARSDRAVPCGSFGSIDTNGTNELRFSWVTCADAGADERYISFDVTSAAGQLLGREDIPFELVSDGFYVLPDLI
jgi:hypothetical protein